MIVRPNVVKDLKELAENEDVKAVVLRVNSPGGSAYASEQIWHQVMNIKAKKPIVVSMGDYAASGGYYISCAADWIVAEPTTLTGSIGIFGTFPVASELMNKKIGLHTSTVKTNEFADFGDFSREMTEGEKQLLQGYVNRGYELFTKRCAEGRKMKQDDIKKIAEGRVWTGEHAKQIGLVDQLGSLDDAIAVAKKRAKIDEYTVLSYPAKSDLFEELLNLFRCLAFINHVTIILTGICCFHGITKVKTITHVISRFLRTHSLKIFVGKFIQSTAIIFLFCFFFSCFSSIRCTIILTTACK
jgi:protease-4